jgi:hypothetical protein
MRLVLLTLLLVFCSTAHARDLPSGVAWIHELELPLQANLVTTGDRVVALAGTDLTGLRARDGQTVWTVPGIYANSLRVHEGLVVVQHAWEVAVYDPEDGRLLWKETYDRSSWRYAQGRIWHLRNGELLARDLRTGHVRWRRTLPNIYRFWVDARGVAWSDSKTLHWLGFRSAPWELDCSVEELLRTPAGWLAQLGSGACLISPAGKRVWRNDEATRPVLIGDVVVGYNLQGLDLYTGRRLWTREFFYTYFRLGQWLVLDKSDQLVFIHPRSGKTVRRIFGSRYMRAVAGPGVVDILTSPGSLTRYRASDLQPVGKWQNLLPDFPHEYTMVDGASSATHTYHGVHASVAALGEGPGHVLYDGPPEVSLNTGYTQAPRMRVVVFARNLRAVEIELWQNGRRLGYQVRRVAAGADKSVGEAFFPVRAGVYEVVVRGRGALARETVQVR